MTRFLLYGGKGGVGKTTCAAATAVGLARTGLETLVVSTDPAHSLSDSFERDVDAEPTVIEDHLWAVEIDPEARMDEYEAMFATLFDEFADVGVRVEDDQVEDMFAAGIAPGSDEVAALDMLVEYSDSEASETPQEAGGTGDREGRSPSSNRPQAGDSTRWDVIVLDTAPTGHTLRLLDIPEVVGATVRTAMSIRGQVRRIADSTKRMLLGPAYYMGRREAETPDRFADLQSRMERVASILRDPAQTEFRVVLVPERMALSETERLVAQLEDSEIPVDGLVVNKVLTDPSPDCSRCRARHDTQQAIVEETCDRFPNHEVTTLPEQETDVHGVDALADLADWLVD